MRAQRITLSLGGLIVAAAALSAQQSAPPPPPAQAKADTTAAAITPALIARGDSIFHGQVAAGTCAVCHGPTGTGVPGMTHDLTSPQRINGDGSYKSMMQIVRDGVTPMQGVPMPPNGGASLTPLDVQAVAAYVYCLSHTGGSCTKN